MSNRSPEYPRGTSRRSFIGRSGVAAAGFIMFPELASSALAGSDSGLSLARATGIPSENDKSTNVAQSRIKAIHAASASQDSHNSTREEIERMADAIATIDKANYVAISTHIDHPDQFAHWANAIHDRGMGVIFNTVGSNAFTGHNGVRLTETPDEYENRSDRFINENANVFRNGDIYVAVPNGSEDHPYWPATFTGGLGSAEGKAAFNRFAQNSIERSKRSFESNGVQVDTGILFTNASATLEVIDRTTAERAGKLGINSFPERVGDQILMDPTEAGNAMRAEIDRYVKPVQQESGIPYIITTGPLTWAEVSEELQVRLLEEELRVVQEAVDPLGGIIFWQFGAKGNDPKSRLFNEENGNWTPRRAAEAVNEIFARL
jgi:hypothetical protein